MPAAESDQQGDGQLATAISTMVVRVLRAHTGRGPTKSRTHLIDDLVCVVVQDILTRAERTLVAGGLTSHVTAARKALHDAMSAELIAGVEKLTGRGVLAVFSDNVFEPDMTLTAFLLAPLAGASRSRSTRRAAA
jgi:uncharacterized protein YbcI